MPSLLLNKVTNDIKKIGETLKEKSNKSNAPNNSNDWMSESGAPKGDIGTGNGISPTTGEKTYGGTGGTSTNYGSYEDDIKRLSELQKKQQIAQLKSVRDKSLANLDVQEQNIKPMYQNQRNLASSNSQQGARSFSEYLANRGLSNSGAAAQGEMNRQSSLQNTMGQIGTAEANAYRDIANQRTAVENDYVSGLANANAQIEADYFSKLLNYNQQQRQYVQALQQQALGQYSNDYQAQINNLLAQGYAPNSLEVLQLQALRGDKVNNQYNSAMNNALANIQAGNINYNNSAYAGMTVPQAQEYYNKLQAQQQAQAQQEAEQLEWERAYKEQQLANDTRKTDYAVNKPYYKPSEGNSSNETVNYNTHKEIIDTNFSNNANEIINYIEKQVSDGRMKQADAYSLMSLYGINY